MANFAKEQLLKYGWTEGKGLGKRENGITEPVKLVTSKNNAGLGYDDDEPWWERTFNDATKNVKVESHDNGVSLSVVNKPNVLRANKFLNYTEKSLENMFAYQKFIQTGKDMIKENCTRTPDQKLHAHCSKTVHETAGHNLTSGGKLERIAEQDKIFLNASNKSQLNANPVGENTTVYRKINVESDMEENEHEIDNNEDILPSEKKTNLGLSKSTRKKHRKRLNNLVRQLDTCTLEENNKKRICQNNRKFCQKMKTKEKRMDSKILKNCLMNRVDETYKILTLLPNLSERKHALVEALDMTSRFERCRKQKDCEKDSTGYIVEPHTELRNSIEIIGMEKRYEDWIELKSQKGEIMKPEDVFIPKSSDLYPKLIDPKQDISKPKKDSTGFMVEPRKKLRNSIEKIGTAEKRYEDWIELNSQKMAKVTKNLAVEDILPKNIDNYYFSKRLGFGFWKQGKPKPKNVEHIDKQGIGSCAIRLDNKIQKKKNLRCHSKQIQEIAEKLKGEALAHELNSVIKNMITFGIAEEQIPLNIIKNKCTQTHRTPV